jgi:hypothetical protein
MENGPFIDGLPIKYGEFLVFALELSPWKLMRPGRLGRVLLGTPVPLAKIGSPRSQTSLYS